MLCYEVGARFTRLGLCSTKRVTFVKHPVAIFLFGESKVPSREAIRVLLERVDLLNVQADGLATAWMRETHQTFIIDVRGIQRLAGQISLFDEVHIHSATFSALEK